MKAPEELIVTNEGDRHADVAANGPLLTAEKHTKSDPVSQPEMAALTPATPPRTSEDESPAPPENVRGLATPKLRTTLSNSSHSGHLRAASEGQSPANFTPIGPGTRRRSVQFLKDVVENTSKDGAVESPDDRDTISTPSSLYTRLKAFATNPGFIHTRTPSGEINGDTRPSSSKIVSPRAESGEAYFPMTVEERTSEDDADGEDSGPEPDSESPSGKQRQKRAPIRKGGINTAPTTPRSTVRPALLNTQSSVSVRDPEPNPLQRRATAGDATDERHAMSEDEGRNRFGAGSSRVKQAWRGLGTAPGQRKGSQASPEPRRPTAMKRLTGLVGHTDSPESAARRRAKAERGASTSALKWRQLKHQIQLRLLAQKKSKDQAIDHEKSAELLAELIAGSPAALMLASMFQRDEHGSKRVPVLLEQLKVKVVDSEFDAKPKEIDGQPQSDRHMIFRIELEYGNGINRMKWTIRRSLGDFANLHLKYRLHYSTQKYVRLKGPADKRMPRFPRSAFPYLKGYRGLFDEFEDEEEEGGNENGTPGDPDRSTTKTRRRPSLGAAQRRSSPGRQPAERGISGALLGVGGVAGAVGTSGKRDVYHERQRKKLEIYLQKMIQFMLFRADSNRLCKFLELSALGMRLAAEGGHHGKEGFLMIQSAKGIDFRKALTPSNFKSRHTPKWFLVRHSYVVCVDSPEEMHVYDVFLFDEDFRIQPTSSLRSDPAEKPNSKMIARAAKESAAHPQHHRLKLYNSERRMKLLARSERLLQQFEDSIRMMVNSSPWTKPNRFGSFAPVRPNCFAQWLVDGRDYMWVVSRAINQAKDVIYIHDWWLSPEIYMRRPPAISQKWRLDRLLKRKAEQGVKIFVIVYRNVESAIPIDSQYTKFSLLDLHPNVFVQRSPNQIRQNTFFWAHHEKLVIVDHTLAFIGGLDLCFGRWDTPQHTVTDDRSTGFEPSQLPKDADHCQLWPGKDYSNPRVQDFYNLNKPYEEMYDRSVVARMPWHDISMQVVGQPARDLTRHFVQRWNYILRQRKPTRPTPFLLPPPDFDPADLEAIGLDGTCEVQILRSCGPWSMGTPDKTEHSIMTAYTKMIEESEHFVYIENQFFISSCVTDVTTIKNTIGEALVERVVRAAKNDEAWRAMIVIPLMPGFQNTVDSEGGTSIRLIMQYQFRSICRGESSIFGRLRAQGIEPEDYIQFYGLRAWGKIGPQQRLVTEQLYIHAKCMIVDDRVAIIGSANINERSMLGNRDSETAALVRDTDMIWSKMNGKPYMVGRFPHTLRMRLMREHLGLDVDKIMEDAQIIDNEINKESANPANTNQGLDAHIGRPAVNGIPPSSRSQPGEDRFARLEDLSSFNHDVDWEQAENPNLITNRKLTEDTRVTGNTVHRQEVDGDGPDKMKKIDELGYGVGRDTKVLADGREVLTTDLATEGKHSLRSPLRPGEPIRRPSILKEFELGSPPLPPRPEVARSTTAHFGLPNVSQLPPLPTVDDSDIGGPSLRQRLSRGSLAPHQHLFSELRQPVVDKDCMQDPIVDTFALDTWHTIAENNAKVFRSVFRCMPDNEVRGWKEYKEYVAYAERFEEMQGDKTSAQPPSRAAPSPTPTKSGPPGVTTATKPLLEQIQEAGNKLENALPTLRDATGDSAQSPHADLRAWAAEANKAQAERQHQYQNRLYKEETRSTQESAPLSGSGSDAAPSSPTLSDEALAGEKTAVPFGSHADSVGMSAPQQPAPQRRRRRGTTRSSKREFAATDDILSKDEAGDLLGMVQGHLVVWPYEWLAKAEEGGNWLYPFDQISPLEIYV